MALALPYTHIPKNGALDTLRSLTASNHRKLFRAAPQERLSTLKSSWYGAPEFIQQSYPSIISSSPKHYQDLFYSHVILTNSLQITKIVLYPLNVTDSPDLRLGLYDILIEFQYVNNKSTGAIEIKHTNLEGALKKLEEICTLQMGDKDTYKCIAFRSVVEQVIIRLIRSLEGAEKIK